MGYQETPAPTDADQIKSDLSEVLELLSAMNERLNRLTDALNNVGANTQFMVDQTKGLFQFMNSPQMMGMVASRLPGMANMMTGETPDE